jgi:hypothetical protein
MADVNSYDYRFAGLLRGKPTIWLAAIALLPIVAISLLGRHYASSMEGIAPIDLTNFSALRNMIRGAFEISSNEGDSWLPMQDALKLLHGDYADRLYEMLFFAKTVRFQYPPMSLLPIELLSAVGVGSTNDLNKLNFAIYCFNAAGVGGLAYLMFRRGTAFQKSGPALKPAGIALLASISAFMFYPLIRAQVLGQIQIWIDALFTLTIIFWLLNKRLLAGICIGLACTIKPQLALLLIWGMLWKQAAFSAGIVACIAPIATISLIRYGLHNHLAYLDVLAFLSRHGESFFANNSVNGILNNYLSPSETNIWDASALTPYVPVVYAGTLVAALIVICLIVVPALLWRGVNPSLISLGAASICTVIGSPVAWEHHYGILLPIYLIALRGAYSIPQGTRRITILIAIAISWLLVANLIPFALLLANTPFRFVQAHCFFGALLLLFVLLALESAEKSALRIKFFAS